VPGEDFIAAGSPQSTRLEFAISSGVSAVSSFTRCISAEERLTPKVTTWRSIASRNLGDHTRRPELVENALQPRIL